MPRSSAVEMVIRAGRTWPHYPGQDWVDRVFSPITGPLSRKVAGHAVQRLLGYWVLFHAAGGNLKDLRDAGWISETRAFVQRNEFREVFGVDVADFMPEVAAHLRPARPADDGTPAHAENQETAK